MTLVQAGLFQREILRHPADAQSAAFDYRPFAPGERDFFGPHGKHAVADGFGKSAGFGFAVQACDKKRVCRQGGDSLVLVVAAEVSAAKLLH